MLVFYLPYPVAHDCFKIFFNQYFDVWVYPKYIYVKIIRRACFLKIHALCFTILYFLSPLFIGFRWCSWCAFVSSGCSCSYFFCHFFRRSSSISLRFLFSALTPWQEPHTPVAIMNATHITAFPLARLTIAITKLNIQRNPQNVAIFSSPFVLFWIIAFGWLLFSWVK